MAARTAGVDAVDFAYPAYGDPDGYRRSAEEASVVGFDGKWAIDPRQIAIANEVFAPSEEEIRWAVRTSESYRAAEAGGTGAIGVDGMLVDAAHMRHVETNLARAARIGPTG